MKVLDRYLFGRLVATLARVFLSLLLIYVLIDLLAHRRADILRYEVSWSTVVQFYVDFAPQIAYRIAPLAVLVAGLFVFGECAQNNEITAALAAGISLRRYVLMGIVAALLFAACVFVGDEFVVAPATHAANRIEENYFSRNADSRRAGVSWANLSGNWTCHVMRFNRLAMTGENVLLHSIRSDAVEQIEARRIFWDDEQGRWLLEDGRHVVFDAAVNMKLADERITQVPAPIVESPDELFALDRPSNTKTAAALLSDIRSAEARGIPTAATRVDFHAKFSQPAVCFVMLLLAIPFAVRLRHGGLAISFGAGITIAILYLLVFNGTLMLGHADRLSAPLAAWLGNIVFFTAGVVLFVKTPT